MQCSSGFCQFLCSAMHEDMFCARISVWVVLAAAVTLLFALPWFIALDW